MEDIHKDAAPRTPVQRPWPSRWKAPALMLLCILVGVGFGLGHHEYYKSYNNNVVKSSDQQQWVIRIGTGLAFLTKTAFTAAIGIAFSQYLWIITRTQALTLRNLDAAFTLTSSPMSFLDFGVLTNAKLLAILALASWLLPLIALVTPATLTVESRSTPSVTSKLVPYPDFDITNGLDDLNNTDFNIWSDYIGVGQIGSAAPGLRGILAATASRATLTAVDAPYPNSSYSIQFYGPCLKCQSLNDAIKSHDFDNFYQLMGNSSSLLSVWDDFGGIDRGSGIYYNATAPDSRNIIFVATGALNTTDNTGGVNITCQLRNASYNVDFAFEQGVSSTTISNLELEPVLNYSDRTIIQDLPRNGFRAYLSMLLALEALLSGAFGSANGLNSNGMTGGDLQVVTTGLMACPEITGATKVLRTLNETYPSVMCRNGSLAAAIEDLSRNFTLSLLSSAVYSTLRSVNVEIFSPMNYYIYRPKAVAISYFIGLGVTLICFLIGAWACQLNGYSADTSFSTIMNTTRNPQLDELAKTDGDRPDGRESDFSRVKLQYGIINQGGEMSHAAFGRAETITRIAKL